MIERIGPTFPTGPSGKERKRAPDTQRFHEEMKVEKPAEAEFEKPKKRRYKLEEEEEKLPFSTISEEKFGAGFPTSEKAPSEERPPFFPRPQDKELPSSPKFWEEQPEEKKPEKTLEKELEKKKRKPEEEKPKPPPFFAKEAPVTSKKELEEKVESPFFAKRAPLTPEKTKEERIEEKLKKPTRPPTEMPPQREKKVPVEPIPGREKAPAELREKKKEPIPPPTEKEEKEPSPFITLEISPHIQAQTTAAVQQLSSYLNPEIVPLFERMVGTLLQMSHQGITTTEVFLTSPAFVGSIFYGSTISLERYSTAPDSYNICLRGPQKAVEMFNDNIEGLMRAFDRGNFTFRIGRLWSEYEYERERPLFRRKPAVGKEKEKGEK